jgi:hypothetical protein
MIFLIILNLILLGLLINMIWPNLFTNILNRLKKNNTFTDSTPISNYDVSNYPTWYQAEVNSIITERSRHIINTNYTNYNNIITTQPITEPPVGTLFYLDYVYENTDPLPTIKNKNNSWPKLNIKKNKNKYKIIRNSIYKKTKTSKSKSGVPSYKAVIDYIFET